MNKNIDMSGFETTFEFGIENIKRSNIQVLVDFFDRTAEVHNKCIYIDDDNYRHEIPIGWGLIGFYETDFEELFIATKAEIDFDKIPKIKTVRPENPDELYQFYIKLAEETSDIIGYFTTSHAYIEMFPPIFLDDPLTGLEYYFSHLSWLKIQFGKLLQHCFDIDFYSDELSELTAIQRFYLYAASPDSHFPKKTKQEMLFDGDLLEDYVPQKGNQFSNYEAFAEINPGFVEHIKNSKADLTIGYACNSLYDALSLEFYQMLALNLQIKKCKNCGKYFVVKGKYDNDYCTRTPKSGTQTCQKIAATANFKEKVNENLPLKLFQKYYKRYHARLKAKTIKGDAFKQWHLEACTMRDKCLDGNISVEDFESWLEGSFKNRAKKGYCYEPIQ